MIRKLILMSTALSIICCAVNLTFHQNEYDVTLDIARVEWFNTTAFKHYQADFVLYNRTQRVLNASYELLLEHKRDLLMDVQVYKLTSNEYRFFPISVSVNVCAEYIKNTFGIKDIFSKTSNITVCNTKKGNYHISNTMPDVSRFPPKLPRGSYKLMATFIYHSYIHAILEFYGKIIDKPVNWNKLPKRG